MDDKYRGIYGKYVVSKPSNPKKRVECIVLEYDDPIARVAIRAWAEEMKKQGYEQVYRDVIGTLLKHELLASLDKARQAGEEYQKAIEAMNKVLRNEN